MSIPAKVGSPAMTVVAAIPYGLHPATEYVCVTIEPSSQHGPTRYGTVHAYTHDGQTWHATAGHYGYVSQRAAIRGMVERAGINVT